LDFTGLTLALLRRLLYVWVRPTVLPDCGQRRRLEDRAPHHRRDLEPARLNLSFRVPDEMKRFRFRLTARTGPD